MTLSGWRARGLALIALAAAGAVAVREVNALNPQNRTAAGIDADHNGIRDEVDALIAREFQASPAQTIYAQRLARVLQAEATITNPTHEQAVDFMKAEILQIGCLRYNTPEAVRSSLVPRIFSATFNTAFYKSVYYGLLTIKNW